jgi:hypothetical protein
VRGQDVLTERLEGALSGAGAKPGGLMQDPGRTWSLRRKETKKNTRGNKLANLKRLRSLKSPNAETRPGCKNGKSRGGQNRYQAGSIRLLFVVLLRWEGVGGRSQG